ncbi:MAG: protein-glutamate O-methyltransferase CheR [Sulfuricurvum sp.]|uniref:CheR family methyltransferase n=1 Tax=Sulfuricurvum sp. TaxID=2025608 RepID=UPI002619B45A|nr:protein-glutamate O-methyltransferase CheR [Sulfuricurvum sp.]MDD2829876.1 protein-glutamate O-methyltransferase CheR [Sulfuricurvum sp.]MDD4949211.1 protein-glutamate O-methyltransferase CheR [Sulfuricurvum sp.]
MEIELRAEEFALFRRYIYEKVGISLSDQKSTLVKGRLNKRLNQLGLKSFRDYYDFLIQDLSGEELSFFVSAISTNVTSFFREGAQWKWLENYLPALIASKREKKIRIWSAGCSSGEEPYTILMFLQHHLNDFDQWDIKILATDISSKVLAHAISGSYDAKNVEPLPKEIVIRSFEKVQMDGLIRYQVKPHLKNKVMFRLYNLVTDPFFFKNSFDMIFCRNVMIYFDDITRHNLIGRFTTLLPKGAPLFLGSSESLTTHRETLKLLGSSIYQRL